MKITEGTRMDIRRKTYLIVEKDGLFLQCVDFTHSIRWTKSPWDAWKTRDRQQAAQICAKFGGEPMLFNSVAGQLAKLSREGVEDA